MPESREQIAARNDADDLPVLDDGDPAGGRVDQQPPQLGQRGRLLADGDLERHDRLHGRLVETVSKRLVEILTIDHAA